MWFSLRSLVHKLKGVPTKSTSSLPTRRKLMPLRPSTESKISPSITEAAKLSNWIPAEGVALDTDEESEEDPDLLLKSKMSTPPLALALVDPSLDGVWTE